MAGHMSQHNLHTTLWWQHAWRTLWRDARAGELRLLLIAVALGVAALSSVSFLADRLNAGLQRDASHLLGGDAVIVSDQVTPAQFVAKAKPKNMLAYQNCCLNQKYAADKINNVRKRSRSAVLECTNNNPSNASSAAVIAVKNGE